MANRRNNFSPFIFCSLCFRQIIPAYRARCDNSYTDNNTFKRACYSCYNKNNQKSATTWLYTFLDNNSDINGINYDNPYPQEFRPNAFKQISYSFSAIRQFETIPISDLDLPFSVNNFSRYDCTIKNSEERYIVALYKYRKTIPLDGSFHFYREEKTNVFSSYDTSIKNIN